MQKKLIALAIAGLSSAAFAQSNVTISGNMDLGYYSGSFQTTTAMDNKTAAAANGSSTSSLTFSGSEALGGGMKAGFVMSTDYTAGGNATNFLNSQNFLELAGNWGSLKLGNINNAALIANMGSQPYGTAIGSANSGNFSRLSRAGNNGAFGAVVNEGETVGATGAPTSGARMVRTNNSMMYSTPSFSGFSASYQWAAKNADAAAAGDTIGLQELGLAYNNGPINVWFTNTQMSAGVDGVAPLNANEKVTHNQLTGNYTFGPATVYAGWTSSKSSVAATADSRSWNLALKYAFTGALTGGINVVRVDDKLTLNQDRSLTGLGLDYAMSKRTTAYGRYENGDNDKSNGATGKFTRYQVGLRHSF
ncbi:MAG: porin [Sulfuritalea sp.]|nr:porin [Sulfuritalea sp.]